MHIKHKGMDLCSNREEYRNMIFETHAHYDDQAFEEDRELLLNSLQEQGVGKVVNIGASLASSKASLALAEQYPFVYAAIGVHPDETKELTEENFKELLAMIQQEKVVAVGEIGLDYYWDSTPRDVQKYWFERQLALALQYDLPVVIHSREAAADTLAVMKEWYAKSNGMLSGIIHCFSYGPEIAKEYMKMGFYFGVGGVVTFKNAKKLKEVVQTVPLELLVLETDCPYLAPVPNRGKRNDSSNLQYVAQEIAALKGITAEEVIRVTEDNAKKLYRIKE